jgi:hypothetical protein
MSDKYDVGSEYSTIAARLAYIFIPISAASSFAVQVGDARNRSAGCVSWRDNGGMLQCLLRFSGKIIKVYCCVFYLS